MPASLPQSTTSTGTGAPQAPAPAPQSPVPSSRPAPKSTETAGKPTKKPDESGGLIQTAADIADVVIAAKKLRDLGKKGSEPTQSPKSPESSNQELPPSPVAGPLPAGANRKPLPPSPVAPGQMGSAKPTPQLPASQRADGEVLTPTANMISEEAVDNFLIGQGAKTNANKQLVDGYLHGSQTELNERERFHLLSMVVNNIPALGRVAKTIISDERVKEITYKVSELAEKVSMTEEEKAIVVKALFSSKQVIMGLLKEGDLRGLTPEGLRNILAAVRVGMRIKGRTSAPVATQVDSGVTPEERQLPETVIDSSDEMTEAEVAKVEQMARETWNLVAEANSNIFNFRSALRETFKKAGFAEFEAIPGTKLIKFINEVNSEIAIVVPNIQAVNQNDREDLKKYYDFEGSGDRIGKITKAAIYRSVGGYRDVLKGGILMNGSPEAAKTAPIENQEDIERKMEEVRGYWNEAAQISKNSTEMYAQLATMANRNGWLATHHKTVHAIELRNNKGQRLIVPDRALGPVHGILKQWFEIDNMKPQGSWNLVRPAMVTEDLPADMGINDIVGSLLKKGRFTG